MIRMKRGEKKAIGERDPLEGWVPLENSEGLSGQLREAPAVRLGWGGWDHVGTTGASQLIPKLKAGLPLRELESLREGLDVPMDRLAVLLGISRATLHRRKESGRLDSLESDRVVRFARLLHRAAEVFESLPNARLWLSAPQHGLGGEVPLEYAGTEVGAREVEDLLGRIEFGVYS